jgi:hypothetical protein
MKVMSDLSIILGFMSLAYGLYLYEPWVSYSVCGAIMLIIGVLSGLNNDKKGTE